MSEPRYFLTSGSGTPQRVMSSNESNQGITTADIVKRYTSGESIRALAASTGRRYGFIHRVLTESGVQLRGKRGATRRGAQLSTFVFAASGINTAVVESALRDAGISEQTTIRNHFGDGTLGDGTPDAVVGVLNPSPISDRPDEQDLPHSPKVPEFTNEDVMFRLGRFVERGVPALVVAPPPLIQPSPVASLVVAPCPVDDQSALDLHLWAFIATSRSNHKSRRSSGGPQNPSKEQDSLNEVERWLSGRKRALSSPASSSVGLEFERLIIRLIRDQGADLAENPKNTEGDAGFDAAFTLGRGLPSIFLFEAKVGHLDRSKIVSSGRRLLKSMLERNVDLGLLVYHDENGRRFNLKRDLPNIVAIAAEDLLENLRNHDLVHVIAEQLPEVFRWD